MVREETAIAEKIRKLFPHEDIVLSKNRKPNIWFPNHNFIIEVGEGNHDVIDVIQMILILIFLNF